VHAQKDDHRADHSPADEQQRQDGIDGRLGLAERGEP
jgi:hypothetical protein